MKWRGRRQSSNVEDERGGSGGFGGGLGGGFGGSDPFGGNRRVRIPIGRRSGGMSIGTLIIVGIVLMFLGINPLSLLTGNLGDLGGSDTSYTTNAPSSGGQTTAANDEMKQFVSVVLAETEDTWTRIFNAAGKSYPKPTLVLFSDRISSACGYASAASGPFYCPGDRKLYIDLSFYDELKRRFQAPGDFAQAYVIAHEVGHHVQNLIGVLPEFNRRRQAMSQDEANAYSVRVELQADCFAGIWANDAESRNILDVGDIDEALNAATQIGDDAIQKRMQGYVVPESFNHGTSAQRKHWFQVGYQSGDVSACDTLSARTL